MNCKKHNIEMREEYSFVFGCNFYFCDECKKEMKDHKILVEV